jgi:hypothetical protein
MATPTKNRRKLILWVLMLTVLLAAGVGAAVPFLVPRLPDPAVANRDELLRWLVARDLANESPETCLALVLRLEDEFRDGVDWDALNEKTTEAQRQQLWKNIPQLFGPWLSDKAETYARLAKTERPKFMDSVFKTLMAWKGADRLQAKQTSDAPSNAPPSLLTVFFDQANALQRDAEPAQRDHISQFLCALTLRSFSGPSKPAL